MDTNGWDAVFAMNLEQVNALFAQQYLDIGPTNTRDQTFLRCALSDDDSMLILDVDLGPAELRFHQGDGDVQVEMELIKGALITLDPDTPAITSAAWVRPNESKLTGSLKLAKVQGEVNQLGAVVMDLGASAYTPTIGGVDPGSMLSTRVGEAVRTFFHDNAVTYTLGIIGSADVPPSVTPTSFSVTTQHHRTRPDSCVLVLIQTDGHPGTVAPLASYPIPDGAGAALLLPQRSVFAAMADDMTKPFQQFGTTFTAQQGPQGWSITGRGGHVNAGTYGAAYDCNHEDEWDRSDKMPWTSDADGNSQPVDIALDGFAFFETNGCLAASWSQKHTQNVAAIFRNHIGISLCAVRADPSTIEVDFTATGDCSVDPGTSIVSFKFSDATVSVKPLDTPSWWARVWGATPITDSIVAATKAGLLETLKSLPAATVDTFRLKCLLFQSPSTVELTGAAFSDGLFVTGHAAMPLVVTPASTHVGPGGTVQFHATSPSGAQLWEVSPRGFGSVDQATGVYTAPSSVASAQVVVVTAVDKSNTSLYGSAMVLVYDDPAAQGIAVLPSACLVTPGKHLKLSTTDGGGKPCTVTWALPPNSGSVKPGLTQGEYIYTAPSSISEVTQVTATAADAANPAHTGSTVIQLVPATSIAVEPAQGSVKLGSPLPLTATITAGDKQDLRWVVYPSGSGTITSSPGDPTKVTYTAPGQMPATGAQVTIVAYLVDAGAAGVGSAVVTLS